MHECRRSVDCAALPTLPFILLPTIYVQYNPMGDIATLYRRLGWSRRLFERLIQKERLRLAQLGVQLHVATKDAASGRREQYITVDGMRYSALSRDPPQTPPEA